MSSTTENQQNDTASKEGSTDFSSWIIETQRRLAVDPRAQPWKQTFGDDVDRGFSGEDYVTVGAKDDVQHNSVAA
jgi:hypothetical protein